MRKILFGAIIASPIFAAPPSFHRQVRPILAARCLACHQPSNRNGGVSLASYQDVQAAADRLWTQVGGDKPKMPKAGPPLAPAELAILRQWIDAGAIDDSPAGGSGETWWSLKPLEQPPLPKIQSDWIRTPIDAFILAKLNENKLAPSPEADRRTLIRRVTFDLHGLPPSLEQIAAFVNDPSPRAYEELIDRLLASPRYGERWARHWLDVAHYADTHGYDKDKPRPNAWPYRDWVIQALNADKPYRRFIEEQLAGDVLFPDQPSAIAATGFIAAGPWDFVGHRELREGTADKDITRLLDRDDMVAATISTFTSMTAHCARCHDHKFDPIKQEDYYSLQAVFAGVDRADRPFDADPAVNRQRQQLLRQKRDVFIELQPLLDTVDTTSSPEILALDIRIQDGRQLMTHMGEPKTEAEAARKKELQQRVETDTKRRKELLDAILGQGIYEDIRRLRASAAAIDRLIAALPTPQTVFAAANFFPIGGKFRPALQPRPVALPQRGGAQSPAKPVTPGALGAVAGLESRFPETSGADEGARRAGLAHWISDSRNVLTWRSVVNRAWHHHFGAGIVDSPNDFGRMGSRPTHPELLDWLAVWFRDDARGSMKALHRLIVTSAAYRQSSRPRAGAALADAENRLLWRMNRARLEAESVRDAVLVAAGKLDLAMGGPGAQMFVFKDDNSPVYDYASFAPDAPGAYRRAIYRFTVRSAPDPFLERLDCPDPSLLAPKRNTTLTAIQALALMNSPFMIRMSQHLAGRAAAAEPQLARQIAFAGRAVFGRDLTAAEAAPFETYAAKHGLASLCRLLFNTNEFLFAD